MKHPTILFLSILLSISSLYAQSESSPSSQGNAPSKTILVLDASGSMWGKIDGKAKIDIAKETLNSLLVKFESKPNAGDVGLMVYGHRSKGDCNDIELIAPVAPLSLPAMKGAISKISPKGKTPMTESVKRAAEALRSTEEAATVILISDGEETCEADPCKVVEEIERTGVNFTAHVVGFDLANAGASARAQMKCIADKSGGTFVEAASADQLLSALTSVVKAPEPTLVPTSIPTSIPTEIPTPASTVTPQAGNNQIGRAHV